LSNMRDCVAQPETSANRINIPGHQRSRERVRLKNINAVRIV
jgi:hypothetical protein